jgi:hypothetical protein
VRQELLGNSFFTHPKTAKLFKLSKLAGGHCFFVMLRNEASSVRKTMAACEDASFLSMTKKRLLLV